MRFRLSYHLLVLLSAPAFAWSCGGGGNGEGKTEVVQDLVETQAPLDVSRGEEMESPADTGGEDGVPESTDQPDVSVTPDTPAEELLVEPEEVVDLDPDLLVRIVGVVVDSQGEGIPDLFVQPCTYTDYNETCHKASTDADGHWEVVLNQPKKIVALHVRFVTETYTPSNCHYDLEELDFQDNTVTFAEPFVLYAMPGETTVVESGVADPVTIAADGISLTVGPDEWFPGIFEPTVIRAREFPLDEYVPCFLDAGDLPDALYVLTPDWLGFSTPGGVPVEFDNSAGLEAGSQVALFVLGANGTTVHPVDGGPVELDTGQWYEFGTGTVSGDGLKILSDAGSGAPAFGWLGWKAK